MKKTAILTLLLAGTVSLSAQPAVWHETAPGIWHLRAGNPDSFTLLSAAGTSPREEALSRMEKAAFPLEKDDIAFRVENGQTYLRFPLRKGEQLYGFGLNFQSVYQRGKILELRVDHYGNRDNGRTHAPTPFYVSSLGYGVFIDAARYMKVYAGSGVRKDSKNPPVARDRNTDKQWSSRPYSDAVEILVPTSGADIYIFGGPSALEAIQRYNLFTGGGCLPPRWGLGFTQRVHRLYTAEDVYREVAEFEARGYPLDFIGLEPGWQSRSYPCTFEWDKTRFPDPGRFVSSLLDKKVRVNLWTNPYVSEASPIYREIEPLTGSHTVWAGLVPDLTLPKAGDIFWGQLEKDQVQIGVSGYKIDEVDGFDHYLWPDVATFPSGTSAEQLRQTYGLLVQKQSDALFRKHNRRTYGLVRASNGGGASFPYVIYNDNYSHQDFITGLVNSGFTGTLWTPEVRASKTAEEWLRRFQSVCFSPMAMINAWASATKPWSFPEVAPQVKAMTQLRMQMMPYWYTAFARYHFEGIPPFRAMNLEPGFVFTSDDMARTGNLEENPYEEALRREIRDQYMAGEYLLVAPVFAGETERNVVLPKGNWYDFYTGEFAGNGEVIKVKPGLDRIPVFVKDGGIVPMMPPLLHAPGKGEKVDLEIRHYGQNPGSYTLYDDDGETFDYEKGMYTWRQIRVRKGPDEKWQGSISPPEPGKPDHIARVTWKFMTP